MILLRVTHSAVRLQRPVRCGKAGVGAQIFGGIRLAPAGFTVVVQPRRLAQHQLGGVEPGQRIRKRKLDALVHPDRPVEDHAVVGVLHRLVERHPANAERLGGDQHPLRVQAVQDVLKSLAFLTDSVLNRHLEIVDE